MINVHAKSKKSKGNNKTKFMAIITVMVIFSSSLGFSGAIFLTNIDPINDNDVRLSSIPPKVDAFYDYITNVAIQKGQDYEAEGNVNDLQDLKYIDGNKYIINETWDLIENRWISVTEFTFDVDLNTHPLDYYDVFLFLEIDALENPNAIVTLEKYTEYAWQKICDIGETGVSYNGLFLERTTKFRVSSSSTAADAKADNHDVIKVEQMKVVIGHDGNFGSTFSSSVDQVIFSWLRYATDYANAPSGVDANWWVNSGDSLTADASSQHLAWGHCTSWSLGAFTSYLDFNFAGGKITKMINVADLGITASVWAHATGILEILDCKMHIKDQIEGNWDHQKKTDLSLWDYVPISKNWNTEMLDDWGRYLKIDNDPTSANYGDAYFQLKSLATAQSTYIFGAVGVATHQQFLSTGGTFTFEGFGFDNYDYPEFVDIDHEPIYNFKINDVQGKYQSSSIDKVEFMLQNDDYYYDWEQVQPDGSGNLVLELDRWNYEPGKYNLWLKATDDKGYSTYELYPDVEFYDRKEFPLMIDGPIDEEIIINATPTDGEVRDAIFDINLYYDESYFNDAQGKNNIGLYIINSTGMPNNRTPEEGLINGINSVNIESFGVVNGPVTVMINGTDINNNNHNYSRDYILRKMISAQEVEIASNTTFLGNQLYAIIYDPNGDKSWASYSLTEQHSFMWEFTFSSDFQFEAKHEADIYGWKAGGHFSLYYEDTNENVIKTVTTDTTAIYSSKSENPTRGSSGPGYGDTYWGEAIFLPWRIVAIQAEFYDSNGIFEYLEPTFIYGMSFMGEIALGPEVIRETIPEWLDENYILDGLMNYGGEFPPEADITLFDPADSGLGNINVEGGQSAREHSHSSTSSMMDLHSCHLDLSTGLLGDITLDFGVTFSTTEVYEGQTTVTRAYNMEDSDYYDDAPGGDIISNQVAIDNRYGTYIFRTISDSCMTSDPWEPNTIDWRAPIVGFPEIDLDSNNDGLGPCGNDAPIIIVQIDDESEIQQAYVNYSIDGGVMWHYSPLTEQPGNPGYWEGNIPSQTKGTTVIWYVEAMDSFHNVFKRKDEWNNYYSYTVINSAPQVDLILPEDSHEYGRTVPIQWTASDNDGDALTFNLYYWEDSMWKSIALSISSTSYTWDVRQFPFNFDTRIKVEATDGEYIVEDNIPNSIRVHVPGL